MTLFLGIAAINTGNNLIYLIVASLLSFLTVSGFFGRRNLQSLIVQYKIPAEVYAGMDIPVFISLQNNRRRFPAFLIRIVTPAGKILFPFVPAGGEASQMTSLRFPKRGLHIPDNIYMASVFPFNFFVRFKRIPEITPIIVFPHPQPGFFPDNAVTRRPIRGETNTDLKGSEGDIISIRNYLTGDPLRHIHWKASARTGKLKIKDLGQSVIEPVLLDFEGLPGKDTEYKLSLCSHAIMKLLKDARPVGLRLGGASYAPRPTREHKLKLLKILALYGMDDAPLPR
jgi:uncharacterized protein (DUF58 family)